MAGRGQQSSVDRLPEEIKSVLDGYLRDKKITQKEATKRTNMLLTELGHPVRLTTSSVNRYSMDMEQTGAHLRESREVAKQWIGSLGAAPQGEVGLLVNEIIRTLSFDVSLMMRRGEIDAETAPETVKMLQGLALTMMRLEKATSDNVKRDNEIRKQMASDAAAALDKENKTGGTMQLQPETLSYIKEVLYGLAS